MTDIDRAELRKRLAELFSGYRAEWLSEKIFDLFTEPSYLPQLTTAHPCFLEGGRGTGKTTALRSLSYHGQLAFRKNITNPQPEWSYFGMYYRINTNRVRAFTGDELPSQAWTRLFAHYLNLEFTELILEFLKWHSEQFQNVDSIRKEALTLPAMSLGLNSVTSIEDFLTSLRHLKSTFEYGINNVADRSRPPSTSMQSVPIDALMREVKSIPYFADKPFFFLIDEYENLDDSQQRVLNTLIKHCGSLYSFKIGVRELGFRERSTLNPSESLSHPADYRLINITNELSQHNRFSQFAYEVCTQRLHQVVGFKHPIPDLKKILPELPAEDEADALGVDTRVKSIVQQLKNAKRKRLEIERWLLTAHPLEIFCLGSTAVIEEKSVVEKLLEVLNDRESWRIRYENHRHAYLFAIRTGKRGIRKHYCGWRVFCAISGANIRYLLELVDQSLNRHLEAGASPSQPIPHAVQTKIAQVTGRRNLRELEGLSLNGAKLTRLLLSLGRVFQVMAENPIGHAPEMNQFHLAIDVEEGADPDRVRELLTDGIMHLALLQYPGSKLHQHTDIRDCDYAIHPIFSAFFGFSHRRKRKMELTYWDILELITKPASGIAKILTRHHRVGDRDLPEQLELFGDYYADNR